MCGPLKGPLQYEPVHHGVKVQFTMDALSALCSWTLMFSQGLRDSEGCTVGTVRGAPWGRSGVHSVVKD